MPPSFLLDFFQQEIVCLLLPSCVSPSFACVSISVTSKPSPHLGWTFPWGKPGPQSLQQVVPGEKLGREEQGEN